MTTTISVSERTLARFHEYKDELDDAQDGVPDHTADSFMQALLDTWEAAGNGYYNDSMNADEIAEEVADAIDVAAFNGGLDDDTARRLMNRLEELPDETARKTARELQG